VDETVYARAAAHLWPLAGRPRNRRGLHYTGLTFLRGPNVTVTVAVDGRAPTSANGQTRSKSNTSTVNIYTL